MAEAPDGYFNRFWQGAADVTESERQRISETLSHVPSGVSSILDVACGDGRITNLLEADHVVGVDMSSDALSKVRHETRLASVAELPFGDRAFELVMACELLEHLGDDELRVACGELRRVSQRYILVTVPYRERLWTLRTKCNGCGEVFHCHGHVRTFSRRSLAALFDACVVHKLFLFGSEWRECDPRILNACLRRLGGKWPCYPNAVCPACGSRDNGGRKGNVAAWLAERLLWRLRRLKSPSWHWVGALFERVTA